MSRVSNFVPIPIVFALLLFSGLTADVPVAGAQTEALPSSNQAAGIRQNGRTILVRKGQARVKIAALECRDSACQAELMSASAIVAGREVGITVEMPGKVAAHEDGSVRAVLPKSVKAALAKDQSVQLAVKTRIVDDAGHQISRWLGPYLRIRPVHPPGRTT